MTSVSIPILTQLASAARLLEKQAATLQSQQQYVFRQLSAWLSTQINALEQPAITPTIPAVRQTLPVPPAPPVPDTILVALGGWSARILWSTLGATLALSLMALGGNTDESRMLRVSNHLWPGNPWVEMRLKQLKKAGAETPVNTSTQQLNLQLKAVEKRLLDAEQKRKPYMTISELKTSVYQMQDTLRQQTLTVDNQLDRLQLQQENHEPVSEEMLYDTPDGN